VIAGAERSPAGLLPLLGGAVFVGEVVDRGLPGDLPGLSRVEGVEADAVIVGDLVLVGVGDQLQVGDPGRWCWWRFGCLRPCLRVAWRVITCGTAVP
jgi:hypothetical protein